MTSRWRRARDREPDRPPALPYWPFEVSNGEFVPRPPTAHDRAVTRAVLDRIELAARRTGIDRRRFLNRAGAVAATLTVLNGCASGGSGGSGAAGSSSSTTTRPPGTTAAPGTSAPRTTTTLDDPGGVYEVPEPEDEPACTIELAAGGGFVFDVHTHHVIPSGVWRRNAPRIESMIRRLVPAGCSEADPLECLGRTAYIANLFLGSDTTVAMLSDVPSSGDADAPVPFDAKVGTGDLADALTIGGETRVLLHDVIAPNFGPLEERLDLMERTASSRRVAAFKVYTAWGPGRVGYSLADPAVGLPVVEKARELGVRVMCAHKGLPLLEFDRRFNGPEDIVAVAAQYPDLDFVVYHGAFERETYEGPYDAAQAATGVSSLVKAMDDHGLPPNGNVYAELGTTWREVMRDPTQAAHVMGKLLSRLGEDRVLWGTDAIWLGSPQAQIMAFRAFQITEAFQEQFGYPALTDEIKAKVLGLNAARLFGIDPEAQRCGVDAELLTASRGELQLLIDDGLLPSTYEPVGLMTRRQVLSWWSSLRQPWTPA